MNSTQHTNGSTTQPRLAHALGPVSVWALSLGCIIGWGSFILPGTTFLPQAGPIGTALAMGIGALVMLVIALNYSFLVERFPVAGGEYTYVKTVLGKRHAYITSWLLGLCYLALVAQNATALAVVGRSLVGSVFQVGFHYTVAGYEIYAGELALALGALLIFAILTLRGVHNTGLFQTILVMAIVVGVLVVCLAGACQQGTAFFVPDPLFNPNVHPFAGVLAILAIVPFAFVGFDTIPQAAEEYQFPARKAKRLVLVSIVSGAIIYSLLTLLAASAVPAGYTTWPAYIADLGNVTGIQALPTFHAAQHLLGPVGVGLLAAAATGAILSGIVGFYMATSRLLFALGRDRMLPSWFAQVHPRYRTPHNAILFVLAISAIAPFFGRTVLGWLVDMSSLGAAVAYAYASLVTVRLARAENRSGLVVTGVVGFAFSLVFIALLLVPLPNVNASLGPQSYVCLIAWVILGAIFYAATSRRRSAGARTTAASELPRKGGEQHSD